MKNSIVFTFLLFGLTSLLLFPSAPGPSNLIMNPGFEASSSAPTGWLIKGPVSSMEPATGIEAIEDATTAEVSLDFRWSTGTV